MTNLYQLYIFLSVATQRNIIRSLKCPYLINLNKSYCFNPLWEILSFQNDPSMGSHIKALRRAGGGQESCSGPQGCDLSNVGIKHVNSQSHAHLSKTLPDMKPWLPPAMFYFKQVTYQNTKLQQDQRRCFLKLNLIACLWRQCDFAISKVAMIQCNINDLWTMNTAVPFWIPVLCASAIQAHHSALSPTLSFDQDSLRCFCILEVAVPSGLVYSNKPWQSKTEVRAGGKWVLENKQ